MLKSFKIKTKINWLNQGKLLIKSPLKTDESPSFFCFNSMFIRVCSVLSDKKVISFRSHLGREKFSISPNLQKGIYKIKLFWSKLTEKVTDIVLGAMEEMDELKIKLFDYIKNSNCVSRQEINDYMYPLFDTIDENKLNNKTRYIINFLR